MTEQAKSSNEIENVSWLNGTIQRSKRHIWKKSMIMLVSELNIFSCILLNNKSADSLPYRAWPDGNVQPLYSPCSGTLIGNKCPDSSTWQTRGMYDISSENERPGEISHRNTISDRMPQRLVKNIYLYRQWEAWHGTLVVLLPVNIKGGSIFR